MTDTNQPAEQDLTPDEARSLIDRIKTGIPAVRNDFVTVRNDMVAGVTHETLASAEQAEQAEQEAFTGDGNAAGSRREQEVKTE
jgi:hypothetical protein